MASPTAAIYAPAGTELNEAERAFFREASPWGFILFARNAENPKQVLRLADRNALQLELASLIEFYSPEEIDLVNGMRVPVTK